jgi:alpha-glucosidase
LPQGIWRHVSFLDESESVQFDSYQCDIRVRGGAIIPIGPVIQTTEQIAPGLPLTLVVVLDEHKQAQGTLYEDQGDGYGYLDEVYTLSMFKAVKKGNQVSVKCVEQTGHCTFKKRLVTVKLIDETGTHYGFGDIIRGLKIKM